jgi:hypothetical protein
MAPLARVERHMLPPRDCPWTLDELLAEGHAAWLLIKALPWLPTGARPRLSQMVGLWNPLLRKCPDRGQVMIVASRCHDHQFGRSKAMTTPRDPFDPDHPPPYWVDEEGSFGGWLSDAEVAALDAAYVDAIADTLTDDEVPDHEVDLADLLAARDATDDEVEF